MQEYMIGILVIAAIVQLSCGSNFHCDCCESNGPAGDTQSSKGICHACFRHVPAGIGAVRGGNDTTAVSGVEGSKETRRGCRP